VLQTLTIRPLREDDLDALFRRGARQFGARWLERQAQGKVYVAVAELDGRPVGRVGLDFSRPAASGGVWLWAASIEAEYQSRGVGSALIAHLEETARERGYTTMLLQVGKENLRAQALYERLGYTVCGEAIEHWSYQDETGKTVEMLEACWNMQKPLQPV
jgi:ribosomal protein S18 acetylase RimI-like enzyme